MMMQLNVLCHITKKNIMIYERNVQLFPDTWFTMISHPPTQQGVTRNKVYLSYFKA